MHAILILNDEQERKKGNLSNLTHKMGTILPACKVAMETPKLPSSVAVATPEECTIVFMCVFNIIWMLGNSNCNKVENQ